MDSRDNQKIAWREHEYEYRPKRADWYWALGIIVVALALIAIILNNLLFAVLILLAGFSLAMYAGKEPSLIDYELNNKGVRVGEKLYLYSDLESFGIDEYEGGAKLILKSKKSMMPIISLPISEEVSIDSLREFLEEFLEEEELHEPLPERLMNYLGF